MPAKLELPQHKMWHDKYPEQGHRELARDLYQLHLDTGISLDKWRSAKDFVEFYYGPIEENGV